MRQIQAWRERETSQVEAKGLKKAAFLKRETSVALACYHYGTEGMKHDPDAAVFYHQQGSCYFNLKDFEKAAIDFEEAIRREPNNGTHYLHRGDEIEMIGYHDITELQQFAIRVE